MRLENTGTCTYLDYVCVAYSIDGTLSYILVLFKRCTRWVINQTVHCVTERTELYTVVLRCITNL